MYANIAIHNFDIICLSETYLDSGATSDDYNLAISGYNLKLSDHPSKNKRSGAYFLQDVFDFATSQYLISARMFQFTIKYLW